MELKDGRSFDQVCASEGCIIEVRGYKEIPFASSEIESLMVTHKRWNFRDVSDSRTKRPRVGLRQLYLFRSARDLES